MVRFSRPDIAIDTIRCSGLGLVKTPDDGLPQALGPESAPINLKPIISLRLLRSGIGKCSAAFVLALASATSSATGCGGGSGFSPQPINLSVSVNNTTVVVPPNGTAVNLPVTIVAPTETATLTVNGLPAGVSASYKESESNPSGLLTLIANSSTMPGTYMPVITVGSSGQTASTVFTLVISTPPSQPSPKARPRR
jgi:hypothetical protein